MYKLGFAGIILWMIIYLAVKPEILELCPDQGISCTFNS
jgi:hypothetical protein